MRLLMCVRTDEFKRTKRRLINEKKGMKMNKEKKEMYLKQTLNVIIQGGYDAIKLSLSDELVDSQSYANIKVLHNGLGEAVVTELKGSKVRYSYNDRTEDMTSSMNFFGKSEVSRLQWNCTRYTFGEMAIRMLEEKALEELNHYYYDGTDKNDRKRYSKRAYHNIDELLDEWDVELLGIWGGDIMAEDLFNIVCRDRGHSSKFKVKAKQINGCGEFGEDDLDTKYIRVANDKHTLYGGDIEAIFINEKRFIETSNSIGFNGDNTKEDIPVLDAFFNDFKPSVSKLAKRERKARYDFCKSERQKLADTGAIQEVLAHTYDTIIDKRSRQYAPRGSQLPEFTMSGVNKDGGDKVNYTNKDERLRGGGGSLLKDIVRRGGTEKIRTDNSLDSYWGEDFNCGFEVGNNVDECVENWVNKKSSCNTFEIDVRFNAGINHLTSFKSAYGIRVSIRGDVSSSGWENPAVLKACSNQGYGFVYQGISTENDRSYGALTKYCANVKTCMKHIDKSITEQFYNNECYIDRYLKNQENHLIRMAELDVIEKELQVNKDALLSKIDVDCFWIVDSVSSSTVKDDDGVNINTNYPNTPTWVDCDGTKAELRFNIATTYNGAGKGYKPQDAGYRVCLSHDDELEGQIIVEIKDGFPDFTPSQARSVVAVPDVMLDTAIVELVQRRNAVRNAYDRFVECAEDNHYIELNKNGDLAGVNAMKHEKNLEKNGYTPEAIAKINNEEVGF